MDPMMVLYMTEPFKIPYRTFLLRVMQWEAIIDIIIVRSGLLVLVEPLRLVARVGNPCDHWTLRQLRAAHERTDVNCV